MALNYEQVLDLLPAYAVGALEAEEEAAVDDYVRLQKELIQSLTKAESATTLLAQGTEHSDLAPDAKERMMARIRADAPVKSDADLFSEKSNRNGTSPASAGQTANDSSSPAPAQRPESSRRNGRGRVLHSGQDAPRPRPNGSAQLRRGRPAPRGQVRMAQPRLGARGQVRGMPPGAIPYPEPKRSFFNVRALTNATMAASLVTLIFMTLLNLQGEAQLRQATLDLRESRARLSQVEGQVGDLSQSNFLLSNANAELVAQGGQNSGLQAPLTTNYDQLETIETLLQSNWEELQSENQALSIERALLYEDNARLQTQLEAASDRVTFVGAATQAMMMFGTQDGEELQGTFFQKDDEGVLVIHGLEPLPSTQAYQFWVVSEDGEQVSGGLFAVSEDQGPTWAQLVLPSDLPSYTLVGVTVEPAGGSDEPTSPMLLESNLDSTALPDTLG